MDISFVIPCYCAEKNIEHVIKKIYNAMMIRPEVSFEIILVMIILRTIHGKK